MNRLAGSRAELLREFLFGAEQRRSLPSLSPQQWSDVVTLAEGHRLAPLLHERVRQRGWAVPADASTRLAAAHAAAARRSITLVSNLARVGGAFDRADLPWAALKGAQLALLAYPSPALRPVRDLDVLVRPEDADRAYALLLGSGYVERGDERKVAEHFHRRHLPGLVEPETGMIVEVHTRLFDAGSRDPAVAFARDALTRAERRPVAGRPIPFLAPHDTALHLVAHAALDQTFDNGPLIFADIAWLARTHALDWQEFAANVRRLEFTRAAAAVLGLSARYCGPLHGAPQLGFDAVPDAMLDAIEATTFGDHFRNRSTHALRMELGATAPARQIGTLLRHALPTRFALQTFAQAKRSSLPVPMLYCAWAFDRSVNLLRSLRSSSSTQQAAAAVALANWLRATP